ncbi:MAG: hypothetical protein IE884_02240 [Sulfuricurvum sp.]|nr:hypothetical protein [Sulfuricurvum sp.]
MNALFNDRFLRILNRYLLPVVILWCLVNISGLYLKAIPIERYSANKYPFFELFRFSNLFGIVASSFGDKGYKTVTKQVLVGVPHRLKGVVKTSSGGFVTIFDGKESTVVALHGRYKKEFVLIGIGLNQAIFKGHGKTYRLRFGFDDPLEEMQTLSVSVNNPESGEDSSEWRSIDRAELLSKSNDLKTLSKTIDITLIANQGFKIVSIQTGSIFDRFGLRQGDIIQKVNNKKMVTYSDALAMYREIPQMRSICISITRNNLKKDLIYEISR